MYIPLYYAQDRLFKFPFSLNQEQLEPKVWTSLVLRLWNFRHYTTPSCLVISVKTIVNFVLWKSLVLSLAYHEYWDHVGRNAKHSFCCRLTSVALWYITSLAWIHWINIFTTNGHGIQFLKMSVQSIEENITSRDAMFRLQRDESSA